MLRAEVTPPPRALFRGFHVALSALPPSGHTIKAEPCACPPTSLKGSRVCVPLRANNTHVLHTLLPLRLPHPDPFLLPPHLSDLFRLHSSSLSPMCPMALFSFASILTLGTAQFQHMDSVRSGNLKMVLFIPRTSKSRMISDIGAFNTP